MGLLQGYRILSVEQYGAGPFGTQMLAALGAEIIKVEMPAQGGDVSRSVGPHFLPGLPDDAASLFFQSFNTRKKSLTLDLMHPEGQRVFRHLAAGAHGVANNLRGDVPAKLGLDYASLREVKPSLVCAHLSAYGREGERAKWPGYDYLMQAEAGYFSLTGEPDGAPARMGLSLVDYMSGVVMALGLVSGLLRAAGSGEGGDVDTSLFEVALHNLSYVGAWQLNAGHEVVRERRSRHPSLTPCQLYRSADGWIYLMCNKEKFWRALCDRIERPEWKEDPRWVDYAQRLQHRDALEEALDEVLSTRSTEQWMACFAGAVPAAPVHGVEAALASDFVHARGLIETMAAGLSLVRVPLRTSQPLPPPAAAPALGADTADLLAQAGIDENEQVRLRSLGVI